MKKTVIFALMILVCTLFLGCPLNPRTMVPKSSEQIRSYMAEKFGGTFEVISNVNTDNETQKLNTVSMSCSQLPGKTIVILTNAATDSATQSLSPKRTTLKQRLFILFRTAKTASSKCSHSKTKETRQRK